MTSKFVNYSLRYLVKGFSKIEINGIHTVTVVNVPGDFVQKHQ